MLDLSRTTNQGIRNFSATPTVSVLKCEADEDWFIEGTQTPAVVKGTPMLFAALTDIVLSFACAFQETLDTKF